MPRSDLADATPASAPRPAYETREVADLLKITDRTVRQYIADGKIRAVRVGKWIRIPADEVDRLMVEGV